MSRSLASSSGATADAVSHICQVPPPRKPFVLVCCQKPVAWLCLSGGLLAQVAKVVMHVPSSKVYLVHMIMSFLCMFYAHLFLSV